MKKTVQEICLEHTLNRDTVRKRVTYCKLTKYQRKLCDVTKRWSFTYEVPEVLAILTTQDYCVAVPEDTPEDIHLEFLPDTFRVQKHQIDAVTVITGLSVYG